MLDNNNEISPVLLTGLLFIVAVVIVISAIGFLGTKTEPFFNETKNTTQNEKSLEIEGVGGTYEVIRHDIDFNNLDEINFINSKNESITCYDILNRGLSCMKND